MRAADRVVNPVLRRELVERWRGRRAPLVVTFFAGLLAAVMLLLHWVGSYALTNQFGPFGQGGGVPITAGPQLGRFLFENLLAFVLLLVLFIAPGYAAAQISGERERRTLGLLQITLVRPAGIVLGKLGAAVAWLLLLVVVSVPFAATAFFLGGVALGELIRGLVTVIGVAVGVAGVGIGVSAVTRRTTASVIITYAIVLFLVAGTPFVALVEGVAHDFEFDRDERPVSLYANPFYGLADATRVNLSNGFVSELPSVLFPFAAALPSSNNGTGGFMGGPEPVPAGGGFVVDDAVLREAPFDPLADSDRRPVWQITLGLYLLLGAGGLVLAERRVRPGHGPRRRAEPGRRRGRRSDAPHIPAPDPAPSAVTGGEAIAPPPPPPEGQP